MEGSRGVWLEFRAVCNRNMLLHTVCDCDSSGLSGNMILKQWDFLQALFLHSATTTLHPKRWKKKPPTHLQIHFEQENISYIPHWCGFSLPCCCHCVPGFKRGCVVQYSWQTFWNYGWIFHGLMDWDLAWDAVGSGYYIYGYIHTITLIPMPGYVSCPWNVNAKWSENLSMFPEKEN